MESKETLYSDLNLHPIPQEINHSHTPTEHHIHMEEETSDDDAATEHSNSGGDIDTEEETSDVDATEHSNNGRDIDTEEETSDDDATEHSNNGGVIDTEEETSDDDGYEETHYPDTEIFASFQSTYACYPLSKINKTHLEQGDQIIMPLSAFDQLMSLQVDFPMLFEIRNESTGRTSHCGVYEFTADEGFVFLPNWMMKNLNLEEGEFINLKNVTLKRGNYIKIQPHSVDFLNIRNPKAALEESFSSKFFCLTVGDTVVINHDGRNYLVDILEAKPASAVCVLDTDCEVDFAPPLDYVEPVKPAAAGVTEAAESLKFVPFTGSARRLDDKSGVESSTDSFQEKNRTVAGVTRTVTESVMKFTPFTGSSRRLDGKSETELTTTPCSVDGVRSTVTESEFRSGQTKLLFGSSQAGDDKSKRLLKEIKKIEIPKKQEFQPFTGKKYKLED